MDLRLFRFPRLELSFTVRFHECDALLTQVLGGEDVQEDSEAAHKGKRPGGKNWCGKAGCGSGAFVEEDWWEGEQNWWGDDGDCWQEGWGSGAFAEEDDCGKSEGQEELIGRFVRDGGDWGLPEYLESLLSLHYRSPQALRASINEDGWEGAIRIIEELAPEGWGEEDVAEAATALSIWLDMEREMSKTFPSCGVDSRGEGAFPQASLGGKEGGAWEEELEQWDAGGEELGENRGKHVALAARGFHSFVHVHPDLVKSASEFVDKVVCAGFEEFGELIAAAKRHSSFEEYWQVVQLDYKTDDSGPQISDDLWGQPDSSPDEDFANFLLFLAFKCHCAGSPVALSPAIQELSRTCQFPRSFLAEELGASGRSSDGGGGAWQASVGSNAEDGGSKVPGDLEEEKVAKDVEDCRSETQVGERSDDGGGGEWQSSVRRNAGDGGAKEWPWGEEDLQGGREDWEPENVTPHMEDGRGSETWVGGRSDDGGGVEWQSSAETLAWGEEELQGGREDWEEWEGESASKGMGEIPGGLSCVWKRGRGGEEEMVAGGRRRQALSATLRMAVQKT